MAGGILIPGIILRIQEHKNQVETAEQWARQGDVDLEILVAIVVSFRIRSSKDRATRVELAHKTGLCSQVSQIFFSQGLTLATLNVCCSMASWMAVLSCSRMLPNSSIQQIPPSARTKAPASSCHSPESLIAVHVRLSM